MANRFLVALAPGALWAVRARGRRLRAALEGEAMRSTTSLAEWLLLLSRLTAPSSVRNASERCHGRDRSVQIATCCPIVVALVKPLGGFLMHGVAGARTFLSPILGRCARHSRHCGAARLPDLRFAEA
jgi:hypothetical protein